MGTALILDSERRKKLSDLSERAFLHAIDINNLFLKLQTPEGKAAHRKQMTEQTLFIPMGFLVTFSIEMNHPCGTARHMSMSSRQDGRIPTDSAVWMIAEILGFKHGLEHCQVWREKVMGHGVAVNIVQKVDFNM